MMGQYFNWEPWRKRSRKRKTHEQLRRYLRKNGFIYSMSIGNIDVVGHTIVDHPEVTVLTCEDWSGYLDGGGEYFVFTKTEEDAMAVKLRWV